MLRLFITHSNAKFKAKVCMCISVPELCSCVQDKGYIPITRMRIADKGRGRGTTTSKTGLEIAVGNLKATYREAAGQPPGLCV